MWKRQIEVIATDKKGVPVFVLGRGRADFEYRSTLGWAADTATVTLYNLSINEMKSLQTRVFGKLNIQLQAKYWDESNMNYYDKATETNEDEIINNTIFTGIITNAVGYREVPEHILQLFCIPNVALNATNLVKIPALEKGMTLRHALAYIAGCAGFGLVNFYGVSDSIMNYRFKKTRTFFKPFMVEFKQLCDEYHLDFSMTANEIQITPKVFGDMDAISRMAKMRKPIVLNPNQVIGNPVVGITMLELTTFLNASIQPGMILDVTPLIGNELLVNGVMKVQGDPYILNEDDSVFKYVMSDKYYITEVIHRGSTHSNTFCTYITAYVGANSMMGANEDNYRNWYSTALHE